MDRQNGQPGHRDIRCIADAIGDQAASQYRRAIAFGLSRSDVIECLSSPITTVPAKFLASRAKRRGLTSDAENGR
jgi:hypothetical protein